MKPMYTWKYDNAFLICARKLYGLIDMSYPGRSHLIPLQLPTFLLWTHASVHLKSPVERDALSRTDFRDETSC